MLFYPDLVTPSFRSLQPVVPVENRLDHAPSLFQLEKQKKTNKILENIRKNAGIVSDRNGANSLHNVVEVRSGETGTGNKNTITRQSSKQNENKMEKCHLRSRIPYFRKSANFQTVPQSLIKLKIRFENLLRLTKS